MRVCMCVLAQRRTTSLYRYILSPSRYETIQVACRTINTHTHIYSHNHLYSITAGLSAVTQRRQKPLPKILSRKSCIPQIRLQILLVVISLLLLTIWFVTIFRKVLYSSLLLYHHIYWFLFLCVCVCCISEYQMLSIQMMYPWLSWHQVDLTLLHAFQKINPCFLLSDCSRFNCYALFSFCYFIATKFGSIHPCTV